LIERIPDAFLGRPSVLVHGDYVPVNVLVRGRAIVAIVDWEHARLGDPLLDAATWGSTVLHHHHEVWSAAWSAFLAAAGVELDPATVERLRILAALRLLEAAAARPALRYGDAGAMWRSRLADLVIPQG
jgi:aminoglycoside phosphotransferase (APT) family kinase protein